MPLATISLIRVISDSTRTEFVGAARPSQPASTGDAPHRESQAQSFALRFVVLLSRTPCLLNCPTIRVHAVRLLVHDIGKSRGTPRPPFLDEETFALSVAQRC